MATGSTPEIEEERRLLYVAMTRAKDQLHLMVPQRFFTHNQRGGGDRHVYAQRTRFIPGAMLKHFTHCSWPRGECRDWPWCGAGAQSGRCTRQAAPDVGLTRIF